MSPVSCSPLKYLRWVLTIVALCLPFLSLAQPSDAHITAQRSYSLSFEELGVNRAIQLRGVEGISGLDFSVPSTQKVNSLNLRLDYRTSSELVEKISHIKIYLNDNVVHVVDLFTERSGQDQKVDIALPIEFLKAKNSLAIQLIGHYEWLCEDPLHTSLWATILPSSELYFNVTPLVLSNDLSVLPAPFFEEGDNHLLEVPIVITSTQPAYIEAATIVASWLGVESSYRGAVFTALDQLPQTGHAIVITDTKAALGEVNIDASHDSAVSLIPNPNDEYSKLLVIQGSNAENIKKAAKTVALGADALTGEQVVNIQIEEPKRKLYDAPAWLPTSRPVTFKELAPYTDFTAPGLFDNEIMLNLQLPPDLFGWKGKTIPVDLQYYYTLQAAPTLAQLQIRLNYGEIYRLDLKDRRNTSLQSFNTNTGVGRAKVGLPVDKLSSAATLHFNFLYEAPVVKECQTSLLDGYYSGIDSDSTIDLQGFYHYMAMPNLASFSNTGFPFNRMADLSETVVVLSETPSLEEYSTLFTLMGHIAANTGYPTTRFSIVMDSGFRRNPKELTQTLKNKDILLLSMGENHPLLTYWGQAVPQIENAINKEETWVDKIVRWFLDEKAVHSPAFSSSSLLLTLKEFESPESKRRTVVTLLSQSAEKSFQGVQRLIKDDVARARVQGGISLIGVNEVLSMSLPHTYYVGDLTPGVKIQWYLEHNPLVLVLMVLLGALLISVILYLVLRAKAQRRLGGNLEDLDE